MKVLICSTSANLLGSHSTGLWIEELASAYYEFQGAGFEVVIASPAGGAIPIDAASMAEGMFTEAAKKFMHDGAAIGALSHSAALADVVAGIECEYDVLFLPGGHGTCADFVDNSNLKAAIEAMYTAGKIVAAVCHGPIAFTHCNKADGSALVSGLNVTCFTDSEEKAVKLDEVVPFLVESAFRKQGAKFSAGDDWSSHVQVDGNLITGQNPQSTEAAAKKVVEALSGGGGGGDGGKVEFGTPPVAYMTYSDDAAIGKPAPGIDTAEYVKGDPIKLGGGKVSVVTFFAKFAKGDYTTIVGVNKLATAFPGVSFVGLSIDPDKKDAEGFLKKLGTAMPEIYIDSLDVSYPLAWDNGKAVKAAYQKVAGMMSLGASACFVVDGAGTIVWREQFGQGHAPHQGQLGEQIRRTLAGEELLSNGAKPAAEEEEEEELDMGGADDYDSDLGF